MKFEVWSIDEDADMRGNSWSVPEHRLPPGFVVRDVHVMTVVPGAIRGDHYHRVKREVFLVTYMDTWWLYSDLEKRRFDGKGFAVVSVPPFLSHAIQNCGELPLHVVALSDAPYNPAQADSYDRRVSSP